MSSGSATTALPGQPTSDAAWPPPSDAMASARHFIGGRFPHGLHHYRGDWYSRTPTHWQMLTDAALESAAWIDLENALYHGERTKLAAWNPNKSRIDNVIRAARAICYLDSNEDPPFWFRSIPGAPPARDLTPCRNGLLDLRARRLLDHTPHLFSTHCFPFDYDPAAKAPRWQKFLDEAFGEDHTTRDTLQEFIGYVLSAETNLQKIGLLVGPKRSGKSTVVRVLTELIGPQWVCSPSLSNLAQQFGLAALIGKKLAVVGDMRVNRRNSAAVEQLLCVSGEDRTTVPRKYRDDIDVRIPARFLAVSNELPAFRDNSGAIAHRFIVMEMNNSVYGREDPYLTDALLKELPGVLTWALDGLERLKERGRFEVTDKTESAIAEMVTTANPIHAFIGERCVLGSTYWVPVDDTWDAWKDWSERAGCGPGFKEALDRDLKAAFGITKTRRRTDGERGYVYRGIGLRTTEPDIIEEAQQLFGGEIRECPADCVH